MSVDCLLYCEEEYFNHDTDYRQAIMLRLKELRLPLRRSSAKDYLSGGMDGFVNMIGHLGKKR